MFHNRHQQTDDRVKSIVIEFLLDGYLILFSLNITKQKIITTTVIMSRERETSTFTKNVDSGG